MRAPYIFVAGILSAALYLALWAAFLKLQSASHRPSVRTSVNLDGYREGRAIARAWQARKEIANDG